MLITLNRTNGRTVTLNPACVCIVEGVDAGTGHFGDRPAYTVVVVNGGGKRKVLKVQETEAEISAMLKTT